MTEDRSLVACQGGDGADYRGHGGDSLYLDGMVGHKGVYICQNSLNCTLEMDACYGMKLYHDEGDFLKKMEDTVPDGASGGERWNSRNSRNARRVTDCGKCPEENAQGLRRHLAEEPWEARGQDCLGEAR